MFNSKDFLIWFNGDALYLEDEQIVYDHSKLVYKNSLGELRSISQKNFFGAEKKENVDKKNPVFHENFSNKQQWGVNSINGRYRGRIQDFNIIAKLASTVLKPNQRYDLEFEYFWVGEKSLNNVLIIVQLCLAATGSKSSWQRVRDSGFISRAGVNVMVTNVIMAWTKVLWSALEVRNQ